MSATASRPRRGGRNGSDPAQPGRKRESVFASYEPKGYPFVFKGSVEVEVLAGGTPSNPDVAEAWIKARAYQGDLKDKLIVDEVAKVMEERGITEDAAVDEVAKNRHLVGFKRDPEKGLYIEGRQLKACIKEAASVGADAGKLKARGWGEVSTRKGILSFVAEHIFVREQRLYLNVMEPTDVHLSFIHTFRGNGIQYVEVVEGAKFNFTVETDREFAEKDWAMLWLTAQRQGIGACRSQSYGRFTVVDWSQLTTRQMNKLIKDETAA